VYNLVNVLIPRLLDTVTSIAMFQISYSTLKYIHTKIVTYNTVVFGQECIDIYL